MLDLLHLLLQTHAVLLPPPFKKTASRVFLNIPSLKRRGAFQPLFLYTFCFSPVSLSVSLLFLLLFLSSFCFCPLSPSIKPAVSLSQLSASPRSTVSCQRSTTLPGITAFGFGFS